jgi:hypothetical protein
MVINLKLRKILEEAFVAYFYIFSLGETAKIMETSAQPVTHHFTS